MYKLYRDSFDGTFSFIYYYDKNSSNKYFANLDRISPFKDSWYPFDYEVKGKIDLASNELIKRLYGCPK